MPKSSRWMYLSVYGIRLEVIDSDSIPHVCLSGIFTSQPHVRWTSGKCVVTGGRFFLKIMAGEPFLFFSQKKMRKSLVSLVKRVQSKDKNDKRVLSILNKKKRIPSVSHDAKI